MSTHTPLAAAPPPGESLPLQFSRQPLSPRVGEGGEGDAQLTLLGCRLFIPSHFNQVQNLHVSPAVSPAAAGAQTSGTSPSLISFSQRALIVDLQMSPSWLHPDFLQVPQIDCDHQASNWMEMPVSPKAS